MLSDGKVNRDLKTRMRWRRDRGYGGAAGKVAMHGPCKKQVWGLIASYL